ncbi:MAG: ABC transporter ATP-binding protein [Eubacteriales bacterium]|jgi:multiple sugar transport system ATP-binding protein
MSSVFIKGLTKKFEQGMSALSNFNLEVADGEMVLLAGPTGSGKSTILRLISGYETPTMGDIIINGMLVNDIPVSSRNIVTVLKNQSLYPDMTVYENLAFSLKLCYTAVAEIPKRIEEVARKMEVEHLLDRKAEELDQLDEMRVILLRAVVRNPRVLLVDKPFALRSRTLREAYRDYLVEINQRLGTTIIVATKDRKIVQTMPYKTVIIKDGYTQQTGLPAQLYADPVNLFVADFMTFPQMESMEATLKKQGDEYILVTEKVRIPLDKARVEKSRAVDYVGKTVLAGFRPESVRLLEKEAAEGMDAIASNADDTPYGDIITLDCGDISVRIMNKDNLEEGQDVKIAWDNRHILLFDPDSEKRIL